MLTFNLSKLLKNEDDKRTMIAIYLRLLNIINPEQQKQLTEKEITLLTEFLLLPERYTFQRFSKYAKKVVIDTLQEQYGWKLTQLNLNNKIYELISKGYLWRDNDEVIYIQKWLVTSVEKLINSSDKNINFNFNAD